MKNEPYSNFIRGKIVAVCESVLREEIGVIAGSRRLKSLGFEVFNDHDADFMIFAVIDSETDHLPVGWERKNWSPEALKNKDQEIAEFESVCKEEAFKACRTLIQRLDMRDNQSNFIRAFFEQLSQDF